LRATPIGGHLLKLRVAHVRRTERLADLVGGVRDDRALDHFEDALTSQATGWLLLKLAVDVDRQLASATSDVDQVRQERFAVGRGLAVRESTGQADRHTHARFARGLGL
jgi:hypothetical protein